jgi:hypothetical protein
MSALKSQLIQDLNLTADNWKALLSSDDLFTDATFDRFEILDYMYARYFVENELGLTYTRLGPAYDPEDAKNLLKVRIHPHFGRCLTFVQDLRRKDSGSYYTRYEQ